MRISAEHLQLLQMLTQTASVGPTTLWTNACAVVLTGHIYLSAENMEILKDELQQNFRVTTDEIGPKKSDDSETYTVTAVPSFTFRAKPHLVASRDFPQYAGIRDRTFHLDHYCFDSQPELDFFEKVLKLNDGDKIYFTGMLVHGQSGFRVNYIHPESHTVCNYYPDFLILRQDGSTHLVEVKSAWKSGDPVVLAKKEAAERLAEGSRFHYAMVTKDDFDSFLDERDGWHNYEGRTTGPALAL